MTKEIIRIEFKDTFGNPQSIDTQNKNHHVKKITEHTAQGEGDKWYWDVEYFDGKVIRLFDVHTVKYN